MFYTFVQIFDPIERYDISDEDKLEIGKRQAAEELTKELMKKAEAYIEWDGTVKVRIVD